MIYEFYGLKREMKFVVGFRSMFSDSKFDIEECKVSEDVYKFHTKETESDKDIKIGDNISVTDKTGEVFNVVYDFDRDVTKIYVDIVVQTNYINSRESVEEELKRQKEQRDRWEEENIERYKKAEEEREKERRAKEAKGYLSKIITKLFR
jgi:hypothetical protein